MADRGDRAHGQWGTYLTSFCQMSKNQTPRLWRRFTKKINWHNEVHTYWCQFWCHIWWSLKTLKMSIGIILGQFCWPSYLTSKLMSISVNLIMSIYFFLWTSSIVCMFDFLIFDIFLTTWHLFDILTHQLNLNHLSPHRAIFTFGVTLVIAIENGITTNLKITHLTWRLLLNLHRKDHLMFSYFFMDNTD